MITLETESQDDARCVSHFAPLSTLIGIWKVAGDVLPLVNIKAIDITA
jgi:hypothetical protein